MKRFAVIQKWNNNIAEEIRNQFQEKYEVDLQRFIPKSCNEFQEKWDALKKEVFGDNVLSLSYSEKCINEMVHSVLYGGVDEKIIYDSVNRYEFYEPDIWISAGYTIRYLEAENKWESEGKTIDFDIDLRDALKCQKDTELYDKIYNRIDIDIFGYKFLHYLIYKKGNSVFNFIFNLEENKNSASIFTQEKEDVTRWSWQKILETERDVFRSNCLTEKEFQEGVNKINENWEKLPSRKIAKINSFYSNKTKLEDYILYLRLTGGELARRLVPLYQKETLKIMDIRFIKNLCCIESFSWQVIVTEIKKQIYLEPEIGGMYFPNRDAGSMQKIYSVYGENYIKLFGWIDNEIFNYIESINENRSLLVKAMIYLYMSSDKEIHFSLLHYIQRNAKEYIDKISTPNFNEVDKRINNYLKPMKKNDEYNDIEDSLTLMMIDDLRKRMRKKKTINKKTKEINDKYFEKLSQKIYLQSDENTLTSAYIILERMLIYWTASYYKIINNKET